MHRSSASVTPPIRRVAADALYGGAHCALLLCGLIEMLENGSTLLDLERQQQAVADAIPAFVMLANDKGLVTFFNSRWCEYTGQKPLGPNGDIENAWRGFIHPEDDERVFGEWKRAIDEGREIVELRYRLRHFSGAFNWVHAFAKALRTQAGAVGQWIGVAMEIEHERQKQQELSSRYDEADRIATALQRSSLPPFLPQLADITFESFYLPAYSSMAIGGDWYDAFELPDHSVAIAIGDVGGKGLDAAVLMGKLRYSMRALVHRIVTSGTGGPAAILRSVEDALISEHPGESATAFLGIISPDRKRMRYANAGHPPPLLVTRSPGTTWIERSDTPLGWRFDLMREDHLVLLDGVARLLLYTDGLIECHRDIIDGLQKLQASDVVRDCSGNEGGLQRLVDDLCRGEAHDDVALMSLTFRHTAAIWE